MAPEQKARPDVFSAPASTTTNNLSNPAMVFPYHLKRHKLTSLESTEPKIPAIEELKENRRRLRRDRDDLFAIYGKLSHKRIRFIVGWEKFAIF